MNLDEQPSIHTQFSRFYTRSVGLIQLCDIAHYKYFI